MARDYVLNEEGNIPEDSLAQKFADYVKSRGGLPSLRTETDVYKSFGVHGVYLTVATEGYYKIRWLIFKDESEYMKGKVFD